MRPTAKHKVVTSGRLTGSGRPQLARKQVSQHPGPAARPEPAYSLYSTDSEDQVTTLHQGLDRCAALLGGILQAEETARTGGAARSRPSTSLGKKTLKKPQKKTGQKNPQSGQQGPGSTTPRPGPRSPAAHSGVKLHPPQKPVQALLQSHPQKLQHVSTGTPPSKSVISIPPSKSQTSVPPPQPSVLLSVVQSSSHSDHPPLRQPDFQSAPKAPPTHHNTGCDVEEEAEPVPVRDTNTHNDTCTTRMSKTHLDPGPALNVPEDTRSPEPARAETVQYLLGELKTLIAGRGSVAERLLSHLEEMVMDGDQDLNQNQLLKETERQQDMETLCNTEAATLQQELTAAQSSLQEVQEDLRELRQALRDTQDELRGRQAENTVIRTELEATRRRLAESERERGALASLAQQRLEEMENLRRMLQSRDSSGSPTLTNSSTPHTEQQQKPAGGAPERIAQYLMSLGPAKNLIPVHPRDADTHLGPSQQLLDSTLSQCDAESVRSDWTLRSGTTFDTRDEAAFRDGLAALDASIANLQKTIQLDLRR